MYILAHLSDVHLGDVGIPPPGLLLSKRILGLASWHLRRKAVHQGAVLAALVADLKSHRPDHTAVTGDLVNISLPEEFSRAARWLATLGPPTEVSVVPGNHDAYVPMPWDRSLALWEAYMTGDPGPDRPPPLPGAGRFPYLRRRGPLALIGISTAVPMPPHMAAGRIGTEQLARLDAMLQATAAPGICRVIMIHHPPVSSRAYRHKQLLDSGEFCSVIARRGAELIVHGHTHMSGRAELAAPKGRVPVVGVPSASARPSRKRDHARYHLYRFRQDRGQWRIDVDVQGLAPGPARFQPEQGFTLSVPA